MPAYNFKSLFQIKEVNIFGWISCLLNNNFMIQRNINLMTKHTTSDRIIDQS